MANALDVDFRHVSRRYGDVEAVHDLSLSVPAGKICVLVGPSGCGKTTTLKMVNRLIEPTGGQILIGGQDVMSQDPIALRRGIGYVIQQVGLMPHLTVGRQRRRRAAPARLGHEAHRRARRRAAPAGRPRARRVPRPLPGAALGRRAPTRRRGARARRRPAGDAHGRAVRRGRPDRPRPAAERAAAAPGGPRQDHPVRDPRHRRGDQDGRPDRGDAGRRPSRPVRAAGRDPVQPRNRFRGALRRRRPRPEAAVTPPRGRAGASTAGLGASRRAG